MTATQNPNAVLHMKVHEALTEFFREDEDLLHLDVNERSITHKLAEHLQRQFEGLRVDCEYNRHGDQTKTLPFESANTRTDCLDAKTVYPDIVVHTRDCDSNNVLVIEVKKSNGIDANRDKVRLCEFTDSEGEYGYRLGLFLEFDVGESRQIKAECFLDGKKRRSCCWCGRLSDNFGPSAALTNSEPRR